VGVFCEALKYMTTRLILIRHSQTDYNLENKYCGFKDVGLNKIGKAQARRIEAKLKDLKIDKIFCSDLKRSCQTAKIIFGNRRRIVKNKNLREINFGIWEGLSYKQILRRSTATYKKWLKNPFRVDIPSGEKMSHFVNRIKKELKKIIKNKSDTVALVTHSGPMRVILNTLLRIKQKDFWHLRIKPEAIYVIEYKNSSRPQVQVYEAT
jgi:alpha-ribazole phosphatase